MNQVSLVGRIAHDLVLRTTATGKQVMNFSIAVSQPFSGEDKADFLPCVVWNQLAENTAKYCEKGTLIGITGRLQRRVYENEQGKQYSIDIVVSDIRFYAKPYKKQDPLDAFMIPDVQQPITP